jgi:hypothetical protein
MEAMSAVLPAPVSDHQEALAALRDRGYAVLSRATWSEPWGIDAPSLDDLAASWADLPPDRYLKDGGRYRFRRHACYQVPAAPGAAVVDQPHRAHWQPLDYNALHGGIERWFAPVMPSVSAHRAWRQMLRGLADVATATFGAPASGKPWAVEAHQFRIDTTDGIGRPTPEGAHRDGVDLVAVFLVARQGIKGGETRVFEASGPSGQRFTLTEPWSLLLLDDARTIHESTPIQPLPGVAHGSAWRDTLVVTCRAAGFQGP